MRIKLNRAGFFIAYGLLRCCIQYSSPMFTLQYQTAPPHLLHKLTPLNLPIRDRFILAGFIWGNINGASVPPQRGQAPLWWFWPQQSR